MKEIAGKFAVGVTAIGEASKRFAKKMAEDESVRNQSAIAKKWRVESRSYYKLKENYALPIEVIPKG